jgi:hypothetical protein
MIVKADHAVSSGNIGQAGEGHLLKVDMDKEVSREERPNFPGARVDRLDAKARIESFDLTVL